MISINYLIKGEKIMKKVLIVMLVLVMALTAFSLTAFAKGETNYVTGSTVDGPAYLDT